MSECRCEATSEIMFLCGYLLGEIQSYVLIAQIQSVVRPAVCDVLPITLQYIYRVDRMLMSSRKAQAKLVCSAALNCNNMNRQTTRQLQYDLRYFVSLNGSAVLKLYTNQCC
jgi:hypothetical protein